METLAQKANTDAVVFVEEKKGAWEKFGETLKDTPLLQGIFAVLFGMIRICRSEEPETTELRTDRCFRFPRFRASEKMSSTGIANDPPEAGAIRRRRK